MKQRSRENLHTRLAKPKPAVRSTQPSSTPSKCQWRWEKLISNGNTKLWAILIFLTGVSYFLYNFVLNANMHCWPCICWWRWGWRRWRQPGWCWLSTLLVSLEGIQMRFSSPIASTTASSSSTSLSSASAIVISIGKGGVAAIKRWSSSVSWKREPGKETEVKLFCTKVTALKWGQKGGSWGRQRDNTELRTSQVNYPLNYLGRKRFSHFRCDRSLQLRPGECSKLRRKLIAQVV